MKEEVHVRCKRVAREEAYDCESYQQRDGADEPQVTATGCGCKIGDAVGWFGVWSPEKARGTRVAEGKLVMRNGQPTGNTFRIGGSTAQMAASETTMQSRIPVQDQELPKAAGENLRIVNERLTFLHSSNSSGKVGVKALRLTCRRLCDLGSTLLIRVVDIDFSHPEASLRRLEDISHHPTISKGVRAVNVKLRFYSMAFENPAFFLFYYARCAEWQEDAVLEWQKMDQQTNPAADRRAEVSKTLNRIDPLHTLRDARQATHMAPDVIRILDIHGEYVARRQAQVAVLQSKDFYQAVGAAMARMPQARTLMFQDAVGETHMRLEERYPVTRTSEDSIWERIRNFMLVPVDTNSVGMGHELEMPDYQCVLSLLKAVRVAGPSPMRYNLIFDLVSTMAASQPVFSAEMEGLKALSFRTMGWVNIPGPRPRGTIHGFLAACLATSNPEAVLIDPGGFGGMRLSLQKAFNQNQGPLSLKTISLRHLVLEKDDLVAFLQRLPTPMSEIRIFNITVGGGHWAEILDALREKMPRFARLVSPEGEGICVRCNPQNWRAVNKRAQGKHKFGFMLPMPTRAESYVMGLESLNPLLTCRESSDDHDGHGDGEWGYDATWSKGYGLCG
ncbi:hypothetical protein QBC34DRAFT_493724 [Podospora aff. communis PSN243]|uniref:Uncharacterized protein n=1 Tax=Podospora aff. communis PSN243 TaxID=3040156 RepID=A0AAV9GRZ4_9PEZI|nr:hypothetical protein QBC34DRAFT_493724 [Podospora aff. communis PSN243]